LILLYDIIGTARVVVELSLCNGTVSVRPSVCLLVRLFVCSIRPLQQRAAGLLLWARWVGDIDRLLHGRAPQQHGAAARCAAANAGSATFSADAGS